MREIWLRGKKRKWGLEGVQGEERSLEEKCRERRVGSKGKNDALRKNSEKEG